MNAHKIYSALKRKKLTVAVAESCTGGLLSQLLTSRAGSSAFFLLGVTAYSNQAKSKLLGIPPALIQRHGAVSKQVAQAMADRVRKLAHAELAVGITGIAGPGGGTSSKPVGTVFIAIGDKRKTICRGFRFKGTRTQIRKQAAHKSLILLYQRAHSQTRKHAHTLT